MAIFPASSSPLALYLAVYCYNAQQQVTAEGAYQQLCEYSASVTVTSLEAAALSLANREAPTTRTSFPVGQYQFLRFDVQAAGLTEVHVEVGNSSQKKPLMGSTHAAGADDGAGDGAKNCACCSGRCCAWSGQSRTMGHRQLSRG